MASYSYSPYIKFKMPEVCYRRDTGPRLPSLLSDRWVPSGIPVKTLGRLLYDDPIFQTREDEAQREIAIKRTRIAPAYNKGAYQYITDDTDPKTLGRKI